VQQHYENDAHILIFVQNLNDRIGLCLCNVNTEAIIKKKKNIGLLKLAIMEVFLENSFRVSHSKLIFAKHPTND